MKNKTARIAVDIIMVIVGIIFLIWGIRDAYLFSKKPEMADNVKFKRSYRSVPEDNIYKYVDLEEAKELILNGSGMLLIGKTTDPWMQVLVAPLNDLVRNSYEAIYYLEMNDINIYEDYDLEYSLKGDTFPHILIVQEGQVEKELSYNSIFDEDYDGVPIDYFDEKRTEELKIKLID